MNTGPKSYDVRPQLEASTNPEIASDEAWSDEEPRPWAVVLFVVGMFAAFMGAFFFLHHVAETGGGVELW